MKSFEQEVKDHFRAAGVPFTDNSAEYHLLDFTVPKFITEKNGGKPIEHTLFLEVKEKRQHYNLNNWTIIDPANEANTFIADESSLKRMMVRAPFSGLLVRDNLPGQYYWFSILDLFLMPKVRMNREIMKGDSVALKGKIMLDFRNALNANTLPGILDKIRKNLSDSERAYFQVNECHGRYAGEKIPGQGVTRTTDYWDKDISDTR